MAFLANSETHPFSLLSSVLSSVHASISSSTLLKAAFFKNLATSVASTSFSSLPNPLAMAFFAFSVAHFTFAALSAAFAVHAPISFLTRSTVASFTNFFTSSSFTSPSSLPIVFVMAFLANSETHPFSLLSSVLPSVHASISSSTLLKAAFFKNLVTSVASTSFSSLPNPLAMAFFAFSVAHFSFDSLDSGLLHKLQHFFFLHIAVLSAHCLCNGLFGELRNTSLQLTFVGFAFRACIHFFLHATQGSLFQKPCHISCIHILLELAQSFSHGLFRLLRRTFHFCGLVGCVCSACAHFFFDSLDSGLLHKLLHFFFLHIAVPH